MNVIDLNVALIPPRHVQEEAIKLSQAIASKYKTQITLSYNTNFPHITLYMISVYENQFDKLISTVKKAINNVDSIEFEFDGYGGREGYVDVSLRKTEKIECFHIQILNSLNKIRNGIVRDKYKKTGGFYKRTDDVSRSNIDKYGVPDVSSLYRPHMTITRLNDEEIAGKIRKDINWPIEKFRVHEIGIFHKGSNGTCKELVQSYKLDV